MRRFGSVLSVVVLMMVMMLVVPAPALAQPNCWDGQIQAFTNSFEKRLIDPKTEKHLLKSGDCASEQPPGEGQ